MQHNQKILGILYDTAFKLSELSPVQKEEEIEIMLSYDMYKDAVAEIESHTFNWDSAPFITGECKVNTPSNITFKITCKHIKETLIQRKLQECFKILTDGIKA